MRTLATTHPETAQAITCQVIEPETDHPAPHGPSREARTWRDCALAALDLGNARTALDIICQGLSHIAASELVNELDIAVLLVALAEIEESLGRFDDAATTVAEAITILDDMTSGRADGQSVVLWCQAQERLADLERLAGRTDAAIARLTALLARASSAFGEGSLRVVSAANALGLAHRQAGDLGAAAGAYRRALAALASSGENQPTLLAGLLHNLASLTRSQSDTAGGVGLADAMACTNLAVLAAAQGRNVEAEELGRGALKIVGAALGPDDSEAGGIVLNLRRAS
jgi:tetratricopeptide (TPR) repeat protein